MAETPFTVLLLNPKSILTFILTVPKSQFIYIRVEVVIAAQGSISKL
jgi:hypothetical protein